MLQQYLWICTTCEQQGEVRCIEPSDLSHLPDLILRPSHKKKSPSCKRIDIFWESEGKLFRVTEPYRTSSSADLPPLEVQLPLLVQSKIILRFISWYVRRAPKIIIIESIKETPQRRAELLQRAVQAADKRAEIIVQEGVPFTKEKLLSYELPLKATDQKQTLVFVGLEHGYETWVRLVTACKKTFLLERTVRFYC